MRLTTRIRFFAALIQVGCFGVAAAVTDDDVTRALMSVAAVCGAGLAFHWWGQLRSERSLRDADMHG